MSTPVQIFSTRPLDASFVDKAAAQGMVLTSQAFIRIDRIVNDSVANAMMHTGPYLVFTSVNAVRSWNENIKASGMFLPRKEIFCLDGETKTAATEIGNSSIAGTAKNAYALAHHIIGLRTIETVSFICGTKRLDELPEQLRKNGITVSEIPVYATVPVPKKIERRYDGFLFFSPSAAESFFSANQLPQGAPCFCIGPTTATAVQSFTNNPVKTAAATSVESVLQTAAAFFKSH